MHVQTIPTRDNSASFWHQRHLLLWRKNFNQKRNTHGNGCKGLMMMIQNSPTVWHYKQLLGNTLNFSTGGSKYLHSGFYKNCNMYCRATLSLWHIQAWFLRKIFRLSIGKSENKFWLSRIYLGYVKESNNKGWTVVFPVAAIVYKSYFELCILRMTPFFHFYVPMIEDSSHHCLNTTSWEDFYYIISFWCIIDHLNYL